MNARVPAADINLLNKVAFSYCPIINRERNVMATRLSVFPLLPGAQLQAAPLLESLGQVWPADGGRVSLNILSESLLQDLFNHKPTSNIILEIPAFMAEDAQNIELIKALRRNGNELWIKGRPIEEIPRELLPCFTQSIIDLSSDRRINENATEALKHQRSIAFVQTGIHSIAEMDGSFRRGAEAILGWPIDDAVKSDNGKAGQQSDMQVIIDLIRRVDNADPIDQLEKTLRRDPTLAFKLMRYINSPVFGLSVEITSFQHAVMMLGYKRLKRWLALLLVTSNRDVNMRPVTYAAIRRGMLMEELGRNVGDDDMRGEMFVCGVFSLLDRMMGEPFDKLLSNIPIPERVYDALVHQKGVYHPYIELVRTIEGSELQPIKDAAEALMTGMSEVNKALLIALGNAYKLQ